MVRFTYGTTPLQKTTKTLKYAVQTFNHVNDVVFLCKSMMKMQTWSLKFTLVSNTNQRDTPTMQRKQKRRRVEFWFAEGEIKI